MSSELRRKTPEELLREIQAEEPAPKLGYLKIFLGYASGVGKSYRMLDEARRRKERGQDVVIGALQDKAAPEVESLARRLEVVAFLRIDGGTAVDVNAILRRHPTVCFIDGLAYNNPPGSRHPTRWEDVQELLNARIKVVTSINIQYISELREQVEQLTGKQVQATVPASFVKTADEIEIVDAPPQESIAHTQEEEMDIDKRRRQLSKLRELALVLAADVVDFQLQQYLEQHGIRQPLGTHERLLVCITPRTNVREMLDTARGIAARFHADLIAAYVNQPEISGSDKAALEERLDLARAVGARIEILGGTDPASAIMEFAKSHGITQLFIGHSQRSGIGPRLWGNPVDRLIQEARGMDIRIFPQ